MSAACGTRRKRRHAPAALLACGALVLVASRPARAEPPGSADPAESAAEPPVSEAPPADTPRARTGEVSGPVTWDAPPQCPGASAVREAAERYIGSALEAVNLRGFRVEALVREDPNGFLLDMTISSPSGSTRKSLVAASCVALVKVVALSVALAADPIGLVETVPEEPRRSPARVPPPPRWSPAMRLAGGAGAGVPPGVAPAVSLVASLERSALRGELGVAYFFPSEIHYGNLPEVGASIELFTGIARLCVNAKVLGIETPICAGAQGGAMRGTGFGLPIRKGVNRPWFALTVGPGLAVPLSSRLVVMAEVDAVLALARPSYSIRNLGRIYAAPFGSAQGWVGLEVRFP
jgi:hypothetical protein